jgi:hypothetical protein
MDFNIENNINYKFVKNGNIGIVQELSGIIFITFYLNKD